MNGMNASTPSLLIQFRRPWRLTPLTSPDGAEIRDRHNLLILRGLALLAEAGQDAEEAPAWQQRLEGKLDLALLMLADVLAERQSMPAAKPLSLNTEQVHLPDEPPHPAGENMLLSVYLDPGLPLPVNLTATTVGAGTEGCTLRLAPLSDELDHWLGVTLFRFHREQLRRRG